MLDVFEFGNTVDATTKSPTANCPTHSWWGFICNRNKDQWLLLDSETRLVLEFNARELAKENVVYGLGEK